MVERGTNSQSAGHTPESLSRRPHAVTFFDAMVHAAKLSHNAGVAGDVELRDIYALEATCWAINLAQSPEHQMQVVHRRMAAMGTFNLRTGEYIDPEGATQVITDGRINEIYPNNPFPPNVNRA